MLILTIFLPLTSSLLHLEGELTIKDNIANLTSTTFYLTQYPDAKTSYIIATH